MSRTRNIWLGRADDSRFQISLFHRSQVGWPQYTFCMHLLSSSVFIGRCVEWRNTILDAYLASCPRLSSIPLDLDPLFALCFIISLWNVPYIRQNMLCRVKDHLSDQVGFLFSANAPIPTHQLCAGRLRILQLTFFLVRGGEQRVEQSSFEP